MRLSSKLDKHTKDHPMYSTTHNLCVFCLENISGNDKDGSGVDVGEKVRHSANKVKLKRFIKLFGRFVEPLKITGGGDDADCFDCFLACVKCLTVVNSFCDLYHQLKCLELQLEWKLETLLTILRGADKKALNLTAQQTTFSLAKCDGLSELKAFQNDVISKCLKKQANSLPRVWFEKQVKCDAPGGDVKSFSMLKHERSDDVVQTAACSEMQYFLGWITSFTTVALLALTPVETAYIVPCGLPTCSTVDDDDGQSASNCSGIDHKDNFPLSSDSGTVENVTESCQPILICENNENETGFEERDNDKQGEAFSHDDASTTIEHDPSCFESHQEIPLYWTTAVVEDRELTGLKPKYEANRQQNQSGDKIFTCSICGRTYKREITLKWHVKDKHQMDLVTSHVKQRMMKYKQMYYCIFCKNSFKSYNALLMHKRRSVKHQLKRRIYFEDLKKLKMEQVNQTSRMEESLVPDKENKLTSQVSLKKKATHYSQEKQAECLSNFQVCVKEEASTISNLQPYNFRSKRKCSVKLADSNAETSSRLERMEPYPDETENSSSSSSESEKSTGQRRVYKKKVVYRRRFRCKFPGCENVLIYSKKNYEFHQNLHKPEKHKCNFCKTVKQNLLGLSIHEKLKHSPTPSHKIPGRTKVHFTCPRCDVEFHNILAYQRHFAEIHVWGCFKRMQQSICKTQLENCAAVDENDDDSRIKEDFEQAVKQGRIKCSLCNKNLPNFRELRKHKRIYHRSGDITELEKALKTKSGDIFICPVMECTQTFKILKDLQTHKLHHGRFKCSFCDVVKEYAPDLSIHEMEHAINSERNNRFQCSRCPSSFNSKLRYVEHHVKTHLNLSTNTQTCTICGSAGFNREFIYYHIRNHHKIDGMDASQVHKCDQCPAYFITSKKLRLHIFSKHFQRRCSICVKSFKESWQLTAHMDRHHSNIKTFPTLVFICDKGKCIRRFETKAQLEEHKKKHAKVDKGQDNEKKELHVCSECGKQYNSKAGLYQHVHNIHKLPLQICSQCGKAFSTKVRLQAHMEHHKKPDEWNFQCSTCGRKFASKQKVEQHMRTHTKEKPFICQVCGESYAHRHNWRNHMKRKHENVDS